MSGVGHEEGQGNRDTMTGNRKDTCGVRLCVFACLCVPVCFLYMCVSVRSVYVHLAYVCVSVSVYVSPCSSMHVSVCAYPRVCLCAHPYLCRSVSVRMCFCVCIRMSVCVLVCLSLSVCLCIREALGMPEPHLMPTEIGVRVGIEGIYKTWDFTTPLVSGRGQAKGRDRGQDRQDREWEGGQDSTQNKSQTAVTPD